MSVRRRWTVRVAALAVLPVLALAGCSKDAPTSPSSSSLGPLDQFFQDVSGSYDQDKANEQQRQVEEVVAACMAEQGFDYTPVDYSQQGGMAISVDDQDIPWGTLEFAKKYGYGMTTNPYSESASAEPEPEQTWIDPNQAYVEAMSETEQQAYYTALYGDQTATDGGGDEPVEYDWTTAGCQGKAQHEVYEQDNPWNDEKFQGLQEEMSKVWEQSQNDPRVSEAAAKWVDCMAGKGHDGLATVDDAQNQINEKVNAVYEHGYDGIDTENATEEDFAAVQKEIEAKIAEITDEEIATATDDYTCRDEVKYTDVVQKVQFEIQQEFVDSHKDELEAFKAAMEESQG